MTFWVFLELSNSTESQKKKRQSDWTALFCVYCTWLALMGCSPALPISFNPSGSNYLALSDSRMILDIVLFWLNASRVRLFFSDSVTLRTIRSVLGWFGIRLYFDIFKFKVVLVACVEWFVKIGGLMSIWVVSRCYLIVFVVLDSFCFGSVHHRYFTDVFTILSHLFHIFLASDLSSFTNHLRIILLFISY